MSRILMRLASAAAIAVACRSATAPEPCSGPIALSVVSGTQPSFAWSPGCGITMLTVEALRDDPALAGRVVWTFTMPQQTPAGPRIVYGRPPSGAVHSTQSEPLVVGQRYRVRVMYVPDGRDAALASGEVSFTWFPPD